jgi:hypothetical protein
LGDLAALLGGVGASSQPVAVVEEEASVQEDPEKEMLMKLLGKI